MIGLVAPEIVTPAQLAAMMPSGGRGRRWSAAMPTARTATLRPDKLLDCERTGAHAHGSRLEARVCAALTLEARATGLRLFQQIRLPLLTSAPARNHNGLCTGRALYITIDFALVNAAGQIVRLIDAKGRVSREWTRGAAAVEATYGIPVELRRAS